MTEAVDSSPAPVNRLQKVKVKVKVKVLYSR